MIRRHVLAAIAKGVAAEADGDDVARKALERIDWVLRGRARRRLEQALIDAALATTVADTPASRQASQCPWGTSPAATRHLLRAAALVVQRRDDVDLTDRAGVERAYSATTIGSTPRLPIASIIAAGLVLAISTAVAAAAVIVVTSPPPVGEYTRPTPPPPVGAYRDGGTPMTDSAIEALLRTELPRLVKQRTDSPSADLREPAALAKWPAIAIAWRGMVEYLARFDSGDNRFRDVVSDLRAHVQGLSDQLAAAGLGYFVDLELSAHREPLLSPYRVEKVTFVRAADERVRVLDVRRLVAQEGSRPFLGMKPEGIADPIVLLDQIDEHARTQLMPVLDGAGYGLADDWWARTSHGRSASAAAAKAIRRELAIALGADARDPNKAEARIRKLLLVSVRHHEAQHGREQEHIPDHPELLALHVGPLRDQAGRTNSSAVRARNELSAYTSQIASDMWLPQVALWNLSRHAFQSSRRGSVESFAAVIVIEGLARQLDIPSPGPVIHGGEIDRERLAALVTPLAARPTIELRSAAARLWAELFGEPLVRLVDDVFGE